MGSLLNDLDAFLQEHRRRGELDGRIEDWRLWMTCECRVAIVDSVGSSVGDAPCYGYFDEMAFDCAWVLGALSRLLGARTR